MDERKNKFLLYLLTLSEESSSDSSDEEVNITIALALTPEKRRIKPRVQNYIQTVNLYTDSDFKSHFRLSRSSFECILRLIGQGLVKTCAGNQQLQPNIQLMIALWRMANTETYRSIADRFNVGKATAYRAVMRVMDLLIGKIDIFIHWPSNHEMVTIMRGFEAISTFPNTIGAIDGTEIEIECPGQDYINRKSYASIKLQVVCDHRCLFTNIYVGFPGSTHDHRVFRISPVSDYLGDINKFVGNSHLIGDAAYVLHPNLMVPYKDNGHLTEHQKNFNFCLSSARMSIERAFGLLKGRWRGILNCVPMKNVHIIPKFIATCCILHNICILNDDLMDNLLIFETNSTSSVVTSTIPSTSQQGTINLEGVNKRNLICSVTYKRNIGTREIYLVNVVAGTDNVKMKKIELRNS